MRRDTQGAVIAALGIVVAKLVIEGNHTAYVRQGLGIPLLVVAAFLIGLGVWAIVRGPDPDMKAHDGHHHGTSTVGLALLAPVLVVFLVAPAPLGAFAASRGDQNASVISSSSRSLGPIEDREPSTPDAIDTIFREFLTRVYVDPDTVRNRPIRLVGFVAAEPDLPNAYRLTRFGFSCCAADAYPLQVIIVGASSAPAIDEWLEVTAVWTGESTQGARVDELPVLDLIDQRVTTEPELPYEY